MQVSFLERTTVAGVYETLTFYAFCNSLDCLLISEGTARLPRCPSPFRWCSTKISELSGDSVKTSMILSSHSPSLIGIVTFLCLRLEWNETWSTGSDFLNSQGLSPKSTGEWLPPQVHLASGKQEMTRAKRIITSLGGHNTSRHGSFSQSLQRKRHLSSLFSRGSLAKHRVPGLPISPGLVSLFLSLTSWACTLWKGGSTWVPCSGSKEKVGWWWVMDLTPKSRQQILQWSWGTFTGWTGNQEAPVRPSSCISDCPSGMFLFLLKINTSERFSEALVLFHFFFFRGEGRRVWKDLYFTFAIKK